MMPSTYSKLSARLGLLLSLATIFLNGCSRIDHKQSALDPKGLVAQNQYDVFMLSVWITIFLFCAVGGCLLYVLWKYRAKNAEEAMEVPPQSHGNSKVEGGLIIASTIILVILAIPTLQGVVLMNKVPDANDEATLSKLGLDRDQIDGAITVNVTGKRFFWIFEYPQFGIVTANELVFPVTKAVRINLKSEDVIHSFWIPKLAGKMDVMPGHENFMWFIADQEKILTRNDRDGNPVDLNVSSAMPSVYDGKMREAVFSAQEFNATFEPIAGVFYGQCAEYCGNSHAYMSFRGIAQTDEDFEKWVDRMKDAQNPNLQPTDYDPTREYSEGDVVLFNSTDSPAGIGKREFVAISNAGKSEAPNLSPDTWKPRSDDYERGKAIFSSYSCGQCHALNRSGLGSKGPNLTLFGLRTSLAAGWMRNDQQSLVKWLRNSDDVKMGNLMWNGENIDDDHAIRSFLNEKDDVKVNQLATYLLEQR